MQICDSMTHLKGVKKEEGNYRPISLLTSMSKVIEIIMFKRLEMHLETNDILTVEQFGFRKGVHIDSAIFNLTNSIPYFSDRKTHHDFSLDILEK